MTNSEEAKRLVELADEIDKHFGEEGWNFHRLKRIASDLRALASSPPRPVLKEGLTTAKDGPASVVAEAAALWRALGEAEDLGVFVVDADGTPCDSLSREELIEHLSHASPQPSVQWRPPSVEVTAEHPLKCLIVVDALRQSDGDWWAHGDRFFGATAPLAWAPDTEAARALLASGGGGE